MENVVTTPKNRVKNVYKCDQCLKSFVKLFDLTQHERSHSGEKPFSCMVCNKTFSQKSNVNKHLNHSHRVWPEAIRTLQPVTKTSQVLISIKQYCCQFCSESVESYQSLKEHLVDNHSSEKVYMCFIKDCFQQFQLLNAFICHLKEHKSDNDELSQPIAQEPLKCDICGLSFKRLHTLLWHKAVESHNHACPLCNSTFLVERYLRRHLASHKDPYICPICNKSLKFKKSLKNHMFLHQPKNGMACDICHKSFATYYRLKRHIVIHSGKQFVCPYRDKYGCEMIFNRKDKLKNHEKTHTIKKLQGQKNRETTHPLSDRNTDMRDSDAKLNINIYKVKT